LSLNNCLGYAGLEVFKGEDVIGDVFLQGDQVAEILGRSDVAPFTIIRRPDGTYRLNPIQQSTILNK
jgi:hypothetical protein